MAEEVQMTEEQAMWAKHNPQMAQQMHGGGIELPAQPADPGTPPPADPATPPAEPGAQPSAFDYAKYNVKDEAELASRLSEAEQLRTQHGELTTKYNELTGRYEQVKPLVEVADYLKNPFADSLVHRVNNFINKSGIKDDGKGLAHKFAIDVLTISDEQVKTDPLQAIALATALSNPALAQAGMDKIYRQVARENSLDLSDRENWTDDQKEMLEIKSIQALKTISDKRAEYDIQGDFFVDLESRSKSEREQIQARETEWSKVTPQIVSEITELPMEVEVEGEKFSVKAALSQTDVQGILANLKPTLQRLNPDAQGQAQVKNIIQQALRSAYAPMLAAEAVKQDRATYRAKIEQEVRQANVNGGPINNGTPPGTGGKVLDAAEQEFRRLNPTFRR